MKKTIVTLAISLLSTSALFAFPIEKNGKMLSVTLLEVTNLEKDELDTEFGGAPDGLEFTFVIEKLEGKEGKLSLKEVKDFSVNGHPYSSLNAKTVEPKTNLSNPSQLPNLNLNERIGSIGDQALIMTTRIAGAKIPEESSYAVSVSLGLDGHLEAFEYEFNKLTTN